MPYPNDQEAVLFIDNTEPLYRRKLAMRLALVKKMCAGRYDAAKAPKLFSYLTTEANRQYKREFGQTLSLPSRREAEQWYAEQLEDDIRNWRSIGSQDLTRDEMALLGSPKCKLKR